MRNVTISLQEQMLKEGREYARRHHLSLNGLIRTLLAKTVRGGPSQAWLEECFKLMDKAKASSGGKKWRREDLYRVKDLH